jgi:hypothetical protein
VGCYTSASKLAHTMAKLKSQWEIVTRNSPPPKFDTGTKAPKPIDLTAKKKRPNGEYMTELEWAVYALNRAKVKRAGGL